VADISRQPITARFGSSFSYLILLKILSLFGLLYLFILSITLLGASFKLFGSGFAETVLQATSNPLVGLVIGILVTAIIQSSSTTTSLIVGMVASGTLPFQAAVPMVMGANIGTTVTATIVSLAHISRGDEFKRFSISVLLSFCYLCKYSSILLALLQNGCKTCLRASEG